MASSRDDMVIRPKLGSHGNAAEEASRKRAQRKATSKRSRLGSMLRRQVARVGRRMAIGNPGVSLAEDFAGSVGRTATSGQAILGASILVGVAVAARLLSGKTFETMGHDLARELLGDDSPESSAKRITREQLQRSDGIMGIAGRSGITDQMRDLGGKLYKANLLKERGRAMFMQDKNFQANGTLDIIILRFQNLFLSIWNAKGIPQKMDSITTQIRYLQQAPMVPRIYK